jgi:hypothetical protein
MSFVITVYVKEGIVMASDSRLTFEKKKDRNKDNKVVQQLVGLSDSVCKTFLYDEGDQRFGISTYGILDIDGEPIAGFMDDFFRDAIKPDDEIDIIPTKLLNYFKKIPALSKYGFNVAGYKQYGKRMVQKIFGVKLYPEEIKVRNNKYPCGAAWNGEVDILNRLTMATKVMDEDGNVYDLPHYHIPFEMFTLQDAIDFALYAARTTADSINFQSRIKNVGGPIDILVIKPDQAFWIQRKELHGQENKLK